VTDEAQIYVRLLDEGVDVDVWRPVAAEHVSESIYRVLDQPYDRDVESWEFEPHAAVVCELVETEEGIILAATHRA
jgi:hypothetical protein